MCTISDEGHQTVQHMTCTNDSSEAMTAHQDLELTGQVNLTQSTLDPTPDTLDVDDSPSTLALCQVSEANKAMDNVADMLHGSGESGEWLGRGNNKECEINDESVEILSAQIEAEHAGSRDEKISLEGDRCILDLQKGSVTEATDAYCSGAGGVVEQVPHLDAADGDHNKIRNEQTMGRLPVNDDAFWDDEPDGKMLKGYLSEGEVVKGEQSEGNVLNDYRTDIQESGCVFGSYSATCDNLNHGHPTTQIENTADNLPPEDHDLAKNLLPVNLSINENDCLHSSIDKVHQNEADCVVTPPSPSSSFHLKEKTLGLGTQDDQNPEDTDDFFDDNDDKKVKDKHSEQGSPSSDEDIEQEDDEFYENVSQQKVQKSQSLTNVVEERSTGHLKVDGQLEPAAEDVQSLYSVSNKYSSLEVTDSKSASSSLISSANSSSLLKEEASDADNSRSYHKDNTSLGRDKCQDLDPHQNVGVSIESTEYKDGEPIAFTEQKAGVSTEFTDTILVPQVSPLQAPAVLEISKADDVVEVGQDEDVVKVGQDADVVEVGQDEDAVKVVQDDRPLSGLDVPQTISKEEKLTESIRTTEDPTVAISISNQSLSGSINSSSRSNHSLKGSINSSSRSNHSLKGSIHSSSRSNHSLKGSIHSSSSLNHSLHRRQSEPTQLVPGDRDSPDAPGRVGEGFEYSPAAKVILDATDLWLNKISDLCQSPQSAEPSDEQLREIADECKSHLLTLTGDPETNDVQLPRPGSAQATKDSALSVDGKSSTGSSSHSLSKDHQHRLSISSSRSASISSSRSKNADSSASLKDKPEPKRAGSEANNGIKKRGEPHRGLATLGNIVGKDVKHNPGDPGNDTQGAELRSEKQAQGERVNPRFISRPLSSTSMDQSSRPPVTRPLSARLTSGSKSSTSGASIPPLSSVLLDKLTEQGKKGIEKATGKDSHSLVFTGSKGTKVAPLLDKRLVPHPPPVCYTETSTPAETTGPNKLERFLQRTGGRFISRVGFQGNTTTKDDVSDINKAMTRMESPANKATLKKTNEDAETSRRQKQHQTLFRSALSASASTQTDPKVTQKPRYHATIRSKESLAPCGEPGEPSIYSAGTGDGTGKEPAPTQRRRKSPDSKWIVYEKESLGDQDGGGQLNRRKMEPLKLRESGLKKNKPTKMMTMQEFERIQADRHLNQAFARIHKSKPCVDCHMDSKVMDKTGRSVKKRRERVNYDSLIALENVKFLEMLRFKKSAYDREEQLKDFKKTYKTMVMLGKHTDTWPDMKGVDKFLAKNKHEDIKSQIEA
ncbi:uncharacterized protein LOC131955447 isoform X2 [Physella acuta]|uniref:uncharacterized protein LOC131955447 isoform X2 n=1 Tax=Physella acuta TaxID=109671 RepID=UPI0027DCE0CB|nr:uncharacterized protein LOC131955447 isoform X2 [Physella acuta]